MSDPGGTVVHFYGGPADGQTLRSDSGSGGTRVYRWDGASGMYVVDYGAGKFVEEDDRG